MRDGYSLERKVVKYLRARDMITASLLSFSTSFAPGTISEVLRLLCILSELLFQGVVGLRLLTRLFWVPGRSTLEAHLKGAVLANRRLRPF